MKPFALDENYRIVNDGRLSFVLEHRRRDKKTGERTDKWSAEGYFHDLSPLIASWAKKVVMESDAELPAALAEAIDKMLEAWERWLSVDIDPLARAVTSRRAAESPPVVSSGSNS